MEEFKGINRGWVSEGLERQEYRERHFRWAESIAIGGEGFVRDWKEKLGAKALWRVIEGADGFYELRESTAVYEAGFGPPK